MSSDLISYPERSAQRVMYLHCFSCNRHMYETANEPVRMKAAPVQILLRYFIPRLNKLRM